MKKQDFNLRVSRIEIESHDIALYISYDENNDVKGINFHFDINSKTIKQDFKHFSNPCLLLTGIFNKIKETGKGKKLNTIKLALESIEIYMEVIDKIHDINTEKKYSLREKHGEFETLLKALPFAVSVESGGYDNSIDETEHLIVYCETEFSDEILTALENWVSKIDWIHPTCAYESTDDFSGKKGWWTWVIESVNE